MPEPEEKPGAKIKSALLLASEQEQEQEQEPKEDAEEEVLYAATIMLCKSPAGRIYAASATSCEVDEVTYPLDMEQLYTTVVLLKESLQLSHLASVLGITSSAEVTSEE